MLVCLPLQWGWAYVHVAADAAHTASHSHSDEELASMMVAPVGDVVHSISEEHTHHHADGHAHNDEQAHEPGSGSNAEHHSHYIMVLGLAAEMAVVEGLPVLQRVGCAPASPLGAAVFSRIERPKWAAALSAVSAYIQPI
jgi:hypothetical protein